MLKRTSVVFVIALVAGAAVPSFGAVNGQRLPRATASGTAIHVDVLRSATQRALDAEVATASAHSQAAAVAAPLANELGQVVRPASATSLRYASSTAVAAGVGVPNDTASQIKLAGRTEAVSKANEDVVDQKQLVPLPKNQALFAQAGHSAAGTAAERDRSALGRDLATAYATVADAQLVSLGTPREDGRFDAALVATHARDPERATVSTRARTRYVPQTSATGAALGRDLGLMSEVRQTFAPLVLLEGNDNQVMIEVLGEWVLRAVASGERNGAFVVYGPEWAKGETPVVRITRKAGEVILVTAQDVLGAKGVNLSLPGIGSVTIAEPPRAIGADYGTAPDVDTASGMTAAAAVDIVRVKAVPTSGLADIRIGHMEVSAEVPAGGVRAELVVTGTADPTTISPGETSTTTITLENPSDIDITIVDLIDDITSSDDAEFDVGKLSNTGRETGGSTPTSATVGWKPGDLEPGKSIVETIDLLATDAPGVITQTIDVVAVAALPVSAGTVTIDVDVVGAAAITVNVKDAGVSGSGAKAGDDGTRVLGTHVTRGPLAKTGLADDLFLTLGFGFLVMAALVARVAGIRI